MSDVDTELGVADHVREYAQPTAGERAAVVLADEVRTLRTRITVLEQEVADVRQLNDSAESLWYDVSSSLRPLCPCGTNPATYDGPQRECVLHGDGATFVAYVRALESVAKAAAQHAVDLENGERIVTLMHALDWLDEVTSS